MNTPTFTIVKSVSLCPWWKRPWYWLRNKPTRHTDTYRDCTLEGFHIGFDPGTGIMSVNYDIKAPRNVESIKVEGHLSFDAKNG